MGVPGYHDEAAFAAAIDAAAARAGDRATRQVIGRSVEGRDLVAVRVAAADRAPDPTRPAAMAIGAIHGMEVVASELALALLAAAVDEPERPAVAALLAGADLVVVPCVNPDARSGAVASVARRGVWNGCRRTNAHGVDLNRNWPPARGGRRSRLPIAGTDRSWLPWYRGPAPLSEPETAALADLARAVRPAGLVNLHSTGRIVTYPWSSRPDPAPDAEGFAEMVEAFGAAQDRLGAERYRAKQSHAWYPIVGSSNEWFYDELGTLAVTVELSPAGAAARRDPRRWRWLFWWANPTDPAPEIAATLDPCLAALAASVRWAAEGRRVITPRA